MTIRKEDVELIVKELEVPKSQAEQVLREEDGDIIQALIKLTN